MAADAFDDIFHTCDGVFGEQGVVVVSNPREDQVVQTRGLGDCCAFGFIVRNKESTTITRIALIHSMSEHGELSAFRNLYPSATEKQLRNRFGDLYKEAAKTPIENLKPLLRKRFQESSFVNMLAYALYGIDSQNSTIQIYCVRQNGESELKQNVELHLAELVMNMARCLRTLNYTVSKSGFEITSTHRFAIDGAGRISYHYIEPRTHTRIRRIDSLLKQLNLEKPKCTENGVSGANRFFDISPEEECKAIKIDFLTELKQKYSEQGMASPKDVSAIYTSLAEKHKVSPEHIEATVATSPIQDFLINESLITATTTHKLTS